MPRLSVLHVYINVDRDKCHMSSNKLRLQRKDVFICSWKWDIFKEMPTYFKTFPPFFFVWVSVWNTEGVCVRWWQTEIVQNMYQSHQVTAGRMLAGQKGDILSLPTPSVFTAESCIYTHFPLWFMRHLKLQRQLMENSLDMNMLTLWWLRRKKTIKKSSKNT